MNFMNHKERLKCFVEIPYLLINSQRFLYFRRIISTQQILLRHTRFFMNLFHKKLDLFKGLIFKYTLSDKIGILSSKMELRSITF